MASRRPLDRADRMMLRGLPVATRARTVLDCADQADAEDIRDRALQRGTTILSLETALHRYGPRSWHHRRPATGGAGPPGRGVAAGT